MRQLFSLNRQADRPWFCLLVFLSLALNLESPVRAEENCAVMTISTTRVDGVFEAIELLSKWSGDSIDTGIIDPRYVVSMSITNVEPEDNTETGVPLRKAKRLNYSIHSPSLFFGMTPSAGETIHLQFETMSCDGVFRRFTKVALCPSSIPEQYSGNLEVGMTYQAAVGRNEAGEIELRTPIQVPYHHGVGLTWENPEDLPKPDPKKRPQTVIFKVQSKEIKQVAEREWVSIYNCEVRRLKPGK